MIGVALAAVAGSMGAPAVAAITPDDLDIRTTVAPPGPILTPVLRATLQRRLDRLRIREQIPGLSVAIMFPDGSTWLGTSGQANVGKGSPVTPDTAFALASVSKTFTSALVMALHDDGLIDIDEPVARYLPDLKINRRITVRQLLDHTSGLRDFFFGAGIDHALLTDRSRIWTPNRDFHYVGPSYFKPGKGWHYSNTNYLILGLLAERVGGKPLGEQLESRFFAPLGMTHTYDQRTMSASGPIAHGYQFAPGRVGPIDLSDGTHVVPFTSVITAAGAAGSLASTPVDLVHWARALYGGSLLHPETLQAMKDDIAATARFDTPIPYGLGIQGVELDGHPAFGHSGRLLGFRSLVRWLPQERIAIAVLTNQSRTDPAIIARSLIRLALAPTNACPACRMPR